MLEADDETIELSFTPDEFALIERAAAARGWTVPDFVLREALAEAHRLLGTTAVAAPRS